MVRLGQVQAEVLYRLWQMPLATPVQIAAEGQVSERSVFQALGLLESRGLAGYVVMGYAKRSARRWYLKPGALSITRWGAGFFHQPDGLDTLAARIGHLDAFYEAGASLDPWPAELPDREFLWLDRMRWDAAVIYRRRGMETWSGLVWVGPGHDRGRLERMARAAGGDESLRPGLVAFLAADEWQEELARVVLERNPVSYPWLVCHIGDGWGEASPAWGDSVGLPEVDAIELFVGEWQCPWQGRLARVMEVVERWPGLSLSQMKCLLSGSSVSHLRNLISDGLARDYLARDFDAHYLTESGCALAALRDGVDGAQVAGRAAAAGHSRLIRQHDQGVVDLALLFQDLGCPVVPGWRGMDDSGPQGKLVPDAVVRLNEGPAGPGWHYLEYERRAASPLAVQQKLRSYAGDWRRDQRPVLFVVDEERAERHFQEAAAALGVKLVSSTWERLRDGGVGGDSWLYGDQSCRLG